MGIHHVSRHWIDDQIYSNLSVLLTTPNAAVYDAFVVTATFTKPVTGFALGDITVTNGTASGLAGSGAVYTFTVTPTVSGTVSVSVPFGVVAPANKASNLLTVTAYYLTFTATTAAPGQTLALRRITPSGANITVKWGDTNTDTILNGNVATTNHVYAAAGTYTVQITGCNIISYLDLRDSKISINTSTLTPCSGLTALQLDGIGSSTYNSVHISNLPLTFLTLYLPTAGTYTHNSANLASMALTTLYLNFLAAGTYTDNTANYAAMPLTSVFLRHSVAGTYTCNSANFAGKAITSLTLNYSVAGTYTIDTASYVGMPLTILYNSFTQAGTYTINSANIALINTLTSLVWYFNTAGTLTTTVARGDWDNLPACGTINYEAGLSSAKVDAILLGLYDGFAAKTVVGGTVDVLGNGNAAPGGVFGPACPPTTGQEAKSELVNDSCGISANHYASVTTA